MENQTTTFIGCHKNSTKPANSRSSLTAADAVYIDCLRSGCLLRLIERARRYHAVLRLVIRRAVCSLLNTIAMATRKTAPSTIGAGLSCLEPVAAYCLITTQVAGSRTMNVVPRSISLSTLIPPHEGHQAAGDGKSESPSIVATCSRAVDLLEIFEYAR
jgi:hypothetical protein